MRRIKYFVLLALFTAVISCTEDFLNLPPLVNETAVDYFYSDDKAVSAINGCYDLLIQNEGNSPDNVWLDHHYEWMMGEVASDNARKGSTPSDNISLLAIEKWELDASNSICTGMWIKGFTGVQRCNFIINNLPHSLKVNAELKKRVLGEAYFLRGHFYFILLRHFGGVPIATESVQPSEYGKKKRNSIHEVCQRIEADLMEAINLLPLRSSYKDIDVGRVTNGAARAMLARFYMYQIGVDKENNSTDWNDVYEQTNLVIQSGEYRLLDNYANIFTSDHENSVESIFEYQGIEGVDGAQPGKTGTTVTLITMNRQSGTKYKGWGFFNPSSELFNAFGDTDPRRSSTCYGIEYNNFILYGQVQGYQRDQQGSKYLNRKFVIYEIPSTIKKSSNYNIRYLRYADVLLMHAEAAYHIGNEAVAREYVNIVRKRAEQSTYCQGWVLGKPLEYIPFVGASVPDIATSGEALLNDIWRERKLELACEGYNSWDLIRTGRYFDVLDYAKNTYLNPDNPGPGADLGEMRFESIKSNAMKHSIEGVGGIRVPLLPIPQFDVEDWGLEQNPGY